MSEPGRTLGVSEWDRMLGVVKRAYKSMRASVPKEDGNCYQDAFEFAERACAEEQFLIVHGAPICTAAGHEGKRMGHAWCEAILPHFDIVVVDAATGLLVPRDAYYSVGRIDAGPVARYTLSEAKTHVLATCTWGPWEKSFEGLLYRNETEADRG